MPNGHDEILPIGVQRTLPVYRADVIGTATGGSNTTLQDIGRNWTVDQWVDAVVDIAIDGITYRRKITASGNNSLTFEALPTGIVVSAGDYYTISNPLSILKAVLQDVLKTVTEVSVDTGVADDTSTVDWLDDSAKSWPVDGFVNLIVEITEGTGAGQMRKISSNTATRLNVATPFTTAPDSTSQYRIGFYGRMAGDITHWSGTALTGRDISADLAKLDLSLSGLRDALKGAGAKDFSTLETDLEAVLGQLDVALSTRASQETLASVLGQLDITISVLRDAICASGADAKTLNDLYTRLAEALSRNTSQWGGVVLTGRDISADLANLDAALSTRASEATLASVLAQLDITLSALRDAICAAAPDAKTLYDLYQALTSTISNSLIGTTTDSYADAVDWGCAGAREKTIVIANTGTTNSLHYKVLARAVWDGQPYEEVAETALAAGAKARIALNNAYGRIIVQVKSAVAGNATDYQVDFIGHLS